MRPKIIVNVPKEHCIAHNSRRACRRALKTDDVIVVTDDNEDQRPLTTLTQTTPQKKILKKILKKKKTVNRDTHFLEMEWRGTWWTGIVHDEYRTRTYDISQHDKLLMMETVWSILVTRDNDPGYAFTPNKRETRLANRSFKRQVGDELKESTRLGVNLVVGHREGRMFRDEVHAEGKVHKLVPH
eukprot:2189686-Amphidinium_carterae.1